MDDQPAIKTVASLLEAFSVGVGRITPGPRGSRLSGEPRLLLETALESVTPDDMDGDPLVYGNACYALGRHDDASNAYRELLARDPANIEARFNLGLTQLRLRQPRRGGAGVYGDAGQVAATG